MKKLIRSKLMIAFSAISLCAAAQSQTSFVSKILPPIPQTLTTQSGVRVSYIEGLSGGTRAFSLVLANTTDNPVSFTWSVKDKNGKTAVQSHTTTLASYASVDYSTNQEMANTLVILLPEGAKPNDYSVKITH